ncbi:MAG: hypothetical protein OEW63_08175 [Gammaproteobacteria bacterium]|nr:hypothetical protein [Gammaproteobacteria bacterium]
MAKEFQSVEQIEHFLAGGKKITVPFTLQSANSDYSCINVLRLLPAKRLVLEANTGNQHVVIKLFSPDQKGKRELAKEKQGYKLAKGAGINVPEQLLTTDNMMGCLAVIYTFVENAEPFSLDGVGSCADRVAKIVNFLTNLHKKGIYQDDIHTDNILMVDDELYLIDLGSVVREQENGGLSQMSSLANLAKLVAQFTPIKQEAIIQAIPVYYQAREWAFNDKEYTHFLSLLDKAWQKRKRDYLSKCFRNCTMTTYEHSFWYEFAFRTEFLDRLSVDLVKNIELLMARGEVVKSGNSATVVRVEIDGKQVIIKRYNIKNIWHSLRRCFRTSRAAVSWRNANLLEFIGLPTPKPLGFIENRVGWFRHTAYFINEYTEAEQLLDVYQQRKPTEGELEQINSIFALLHKCQISHGDLKASNLLLDAGGNVSMIDLDAMQEHKRIKAFQRTFYKDKKRFLRNWQDIEIKEKFQALIFSNNS